MSATNDSDLAGAYAGERIFLIGNGPSLAETPLDALEDEYTMAMNRIDLIYDTVAWRPDFYICMRDKPITQGPLRTSVDVHIEMDDVLVFLNELQRNHVQSNKETHFFLLDDIRHHNPTPYDLSLDELQYVDLGWLESFWSYNPGEILYGFHTMYKAFQLILWMGFEEIYILGADLNYGTKLYMVINNNIDPVDYGGNAVAYLSQAWRDNKLPSAVVNGVALKLLHSVSQSRILGGVGNFSNDHFAENYSNVIYSAERQRELIKAHLVTKRIADSKEVDVFNATLGGDLEVYPRASLQSVLD